MTARHDPDSPATEASDAPQTPRRSRLIWVLLIPLALFVVLSGVFLMQLLSGKDPSAIPSALIGKPAPATDLPAVAGLTTDGADIPGLDPAMLQGKASVVNVFASWCAPCRVEHPLLMELKQRGEVQMVGINYKDEPENARRFLGTFGNPYDIVGADETGRAAIEWGVYGVPETFVVGPDGTIRYKFVGPLTEEAFSGPFGAALDKARDEAS
ncbi:DsbE family thiol:disulfide interchange protein [Amorphus orientalis]|uniref:Cytochrome c biogenesis protein CcmG/thiol:disulfide interchange protein DsbE n=1 Tax=Amorphus orientalis TaxID=649198 RepID=A0AAE3VS77_9HYPH|nr:DsbE family thiol:disulfide interchange protein [Amorphus orientalis]MDQ0317227.1 cytochrome c biogenesis protein CcmG/thiol:disulfide interchange protein DsbE [Amorphus orientalis]